MLTPRLPSEVKPSPEGPGSQTLAHGMLELWCRYGYPETQENGWGCVTDGVGSALQSELWMSLADWSPEVQ